MKHDIENCPCHPGGLCDACIEQVVDDRTAQMIEEGDLVRCVVLGCTTLVYANYLTCEPHTALVGA